MKYYKKCETKENLHDVLWCKIAQAFPLTSSTSTDAGRRVNVTLGGVKCDVRSGSVFHCVTGQLCVNATRLCNGHSDCPDASDEEVALCDGRSSRANVIVVIAIALVVMVTLAAVCWLGSKTVDCLSHTYKCCRRLKKRGGCGGGEDEHPSSRSPSTSSSTFDLAASTRLVRARSAFALAAAATRLHQYSQQQLRPHLVVVSDSGGAAPAAYSSILLTAGPSAAAVAATKHNCEQQPSHCCCCAHAMTNGLSRDVSFHLTTTASLANLVSSCSVHQTQALRQSTRIGSEKGLDMAMEKGDGREEGIGHHFPPVRSRPLSCVDSLPPSYSAACGRYRMTRDPTSMRGCSCSHSHLVL